MNRNGRPAHPVDAALAELRHTWGPDAHIKVEQDDRGWYVVTVYARENDQTGRPLDYLKRDTRVIPA